MTWHIFWRHWRMTSNVRKETSRNKKMKIKDANLFNTVGFCILKKTMVTSVIYLLFSYQTGYIMWHSRLRIYKAGNVTLYTLSDSWITYNIHDDINASKSFFPQNVLYKLIVSRLQQNVHPNIYFLQLEIHSMHHA
jgi:hypothetical protein